MSVSPSTSKPARSPELRAELLIHGQRFIVAALGPDTVVVRSPRSVPAGRATVRLNIGDELNVYAIELPEGIDPTRREHPCRLLESQTPGSTNFMTPTQCKLWTIPLPRYISPQMGREYTRVYRLLRLINAIHSKRGLKAGDLARLCEVHERTIFGDLGTLNASGIPCAFDRESDGYRIQGGFFMPPVELTFEEAIALVALSDEVAGPGKLPFFAAAARAAEKIRSQLPSAVLGAMEPLDNRVRIDLPPTMADESCRDVYDTVRNAMARKRALRCTYDATASSQNTAAAGAATAANGVEEFLFQPYALWYCQRAFYAVGLHGGRGEIRRLKLNRFTSAVATDHPYAIPDHFDPRADLGLAWRMIRGGTRHRVAVRFEPDFSDNASETRWHSTQQGQWGSDGRVTLTFTVDGLEEIVWWILGYGPGATVLEPPELIDRVKALLASTAERYKSPG